jgi:hypothetical protein
MARISLKVRELISHKWYIKEFQFEPFEKKNNVVDVITKYSVNNFLQKLYVYEGKNSFSYLSLSVCTLEFLNLFKNLPYLFEIKNESTIKIIRGKLYIILYNLVVEIELFMNHLIYI